MAERPLSNDDFRKLLAIPRTKAPVTAQSHQQIATKKTKKPPPPRPPKPKDNQDAREEEEEGSDQPSLLSEEAAKYRDRAAERRAGRQVDQEGIPEDLRAFVEGKSGRDVNTVSYEESKYLGGDEAHTHLVKGLDFALLEKIRREQQVAGKGGEPETEAAATAVRMPPLPPKQPTKHRKTVQQQQVPSPPHPSTTTTTKISSDGDNGEDYGKLSTKAATAMAQGIQQFLTLHDPQHQQEATKKTPKVSDMFLPRRTTYIYDFSDTNNEMSLSLLLSNTNIPVTLHRSKEDCPKYKSALKATTSGALPKEVLQELVKIMSYVGVDVDGRRRKRKTKKGRKKEEEKEEEEEEDRGGKLEATVQNVVDDAPINIEEEEEEEDIFGDAGTDYVAQRRKPKDEKEGGEGGIDVDVGPALPPGPPTGDDIDDMFAYPDTDGAYAEAEAHQSQQAQQQQKKKPILFPEAAADIMAPIVASKVVAAEEEEEDAALLKRKLREQQQKKLEAMNEDDGYGECYPSFYETGAIYDSDADRRSDGEKPTSAAAGGKEGGKEEEGKAGGGRKKGRTGGDNKDKEKEDARIEARKVAQKEKQELNQIKSIFNKKGYKDGGAFDAEDPDKAKKKGGGKNGRNDEDAQPMAGAIAKKRRI